MFRLMMILFSMIGTALAGSMIVAALTLGHVSVQAIAIAAALGVLLALPISWYVARQLAG